MQRRDRKWFYMILNIAKGELGMDEETYRTLLQENGAGISKGKHSATTMTILQLEAALEQMKKAGFRIKRPGYVVEYENGQMRKIKAQWDDLHRNRVFHQPYSEPVLVRFARKITGNVASAQWFTPKMRSDIIESLKDIAHREHVEIQ